MKRILSLFILIVSIHSFGQSIPDFDWMKEVGARKKPHLNRTFNTRDYGAKGDAIALNTMAIQKTIDAAEAAGGGIVTFEPGVFLTGSVFVGNNVEFHIPKGTMLIGSQDIADYKYINTRVAGVEMKWPSALINIIGKSNASITGNGVIHGKGKVFWDKYWTMRKDYEAKGLRWIVDYDCDRPRGILISDCEDITIDGIVLYQAGFWSLHILYSSYVSVNNIIISNNIEGHGPSTDGVDIDSSHHILVQNSSINCNDDNFCLKAGRDSDGLRVNRPCEYVVIRDCYAGMGGGLFTCGSETSGSIRHIVAYNLKAEGTQCGLRFKSTTQRGGTIEDIHLSNITMDHVRAPLSVDLDWNPSYSNSLLPEGYHYDELPEHWKKMLEPVSPEQGTPKFKNITFKNITATNTTGACLKVGGIKESTVENLTFSNVKLEGEKAGFIKYAQNWSCNNFVIIAPDELKTEKCKKIEAIQVLPK